MTDDNQLIEQLRDTMRAHTADAEVPDGFAEHARQTARRRTTRRAAAVTTPVLAAAAVAVVLVTGTDSGGGSPQAQDTAYIVGKVTANVSADVREGIATQSTNYLGGRLDSHGALIDTGRASSTQYTYNAPDGAVYWAAYQPRNDGTAPLVETNHWIPTADGRYTWTTLTINPAARTYSRYRHVVAAPLPYGSGPNLFSSPSALRRALQQDRITRQGTTTIDDRRAIVLSVTRPAKGSSPGEQVVVDVDAETYQPLRTIQVFRSRVEPWVDNWLAPTAQNVSTARDDAVPSGYRRVTPAT